MHGSSNVVPVPRGRDEFVTYPRPTVLYQGNGTVVTTTHVETQCYRYPVTELFSVQRVVHGGLLQRRYELWARFRGRVVRLFRSHNAEEFGKVCRALTRAREFAGIA